VLYDVDSSDIESAVRQAENNLKESRNKLDSALKQLENLKLKTGGAAHLLK
jgi:multidrug resistance efflux pump